MKAESEDLGQCCAEVWREDEWHPHRCHYQAKHLRAVEVYGGFGRPMELPVCGVHMRGLMPRVYHA